MFKSLASLFNPGEMPDGKFAELRSRILQEMPVPVIWLFGRTGSGKTSIIRCLTGSTDAVIGSGFRPQTRFSRQYDFPAAENPVLRFLDTRGLGEPEYDPTEDLDRFDATTHVMIVTARVTDHAQAGVIEALRQIRRRNPDRPVLLALTCLHEAYPGEQHPQPDPWGEGGDPAEIADDVRRSIAGHAQQFAGLVDRIVPIDLTRPDDGFEQPDFGADRLKAAVIEMMPAGCRQALVSLPEIMDSLRDDHERRAMPRVYAYSSMAATAAAFPVPWLDIPAVLALQSHLVHQLAKIYGQEAGAAVVARVAGAVGGRILMRMAVREAAKFVPGWGSVLNAGLAFASTYALGKACCWYFGEVARGRLPSDAQIEEVWQSQIDVAKRVWQQRQAAVSPEAAEQAAPAPGGAAGHEADGKTEAE